jgi:zinc transport system permease protein
MAHTLPKKIQLLITITMFDFFTYAFLQRALMAGILLAITAPIIGTFLVVRRYSLLSDTLAHVALAGVALGSLLGVEPLYGAIGLVVIAALLIERLRTDTQLYGESILALFLSSSLAMAVVLFSLDKGLGSNVLGYLFGSITTVTSGDLWIIGILGTIIILTIITLYPRLFAVALDGELAYAGGLPAARLQALLLVLASLTIVIAIQIVGALLIGALMILPVMAAQQWRRGFIGTIFLGIFFSIIGVIGGLLTSYTYDIPTGGTIVLGLLGFFLLSTVIQRFKN